MVIGMVTLESGESVKGFLCEAIAVSGAKEISHYGGWRQYLRASMMPGHLPADAR